MLKNKYVQNFVAYWGRKWVSILVKKVLVKKSHGQKKSGSKTVWENYFQGKI